MDNETLTSIFTDIRQRLTKVAVRMLGNDDDAADAVQDAFCRLWQRKDGISTRKEAEGISVVTLKNLCIDNIRRNSAGNTVSLCDNMTTADGIEDGSYSEQERKEVFDEVNEIMDHKLSETQREIVRMREYEGYSYEDIAEILDMQPATVRVQLSRARKLVRECYRNK